MSTLDLNLVPGCSFLNRTIKENHAVHIGFGEMPYCMTCACLLGKLQCTAAKYKVYEGYYQIISCKSEQNCTLMSPGIRQSEYAENKAALVKFNYSLQ